MNVPGPGRASSALRLAAPLILCTLAAAPLAAQTVGPWRVGVPDEFPPRMAPYRVLDRVEGSFVHTNEVPVRPLALAPDGALWSVNTHRGTIERLQTGAAQAVEVRRTPLAPVALAFWDGAGDGLGDDELLVSCAGSDCLLRTALDGTILDVVTTPAGPRDVIVDSNRNLAFVACALADSVLQLDLVTGEQVVYGPAQFTSKKPTFLSFAPDGDVFVTPLLSGNDSTADRQGNTIAAIGRVLDLADPQVTVATGEGGLPDQDVFRLDPVARTIVPVLRAVGTVLFAHGTHPTSGLLWVLNTEALNKDPNKQTEPSIRGEFARNRVTIADASPPSGLPSLVPSFVDLDQRDPAGAGCPSDCPIDPTRTCGQPWQLAFDSSGTVFVCGLLTDNVVVLDANGAFVRQGLLPDGSIPRGLLLDGSGPEKRLYVHCWGTNEVLSLRVADLSLVEVFSLTADPTPPLLARGRALFYDASRSRDNNLSCATCHVDVETDLLAWNLSAGPLDDKGPMMTQTLAGIERMAPFHWRGERATMKDFNPAFDGLLGGQPLDESPGGDFDAFEAFVFSVQTRPNPNQSRLRLLDDSIAPPGLALASSAVRGQDGFNDVVTFGTNTCNECHQMPLGTSNDDFPDIVASTRPKRARFNIAPFHGIEERGDMPDDAIELWNVPGDPSQGSHVETRAYLGAAVSHAGLTPDLKTFVGAVGNIGNSAPQLAADIAAFVFQFDTGLARATRTALYLDAESSVQSRRDVEAWLVGQARLRNAGLAVFGLVRSSHLPGSPLVERAWAFDEHGNGEAGVFRCNDPLEADRSFADFLDGLALGEANAFVGTPYGMAERWAIDADLDGLRDLVDFDPDHPVFDRGDVTPPNFLRGPQALWTTTQVARVMFESDEPTRWSAQWTTQVDGVLHSASSTEFSRTHAILLTGLLPSTATGSAAGEFGPLPVSYAVDVTITDRAGNSSVQSVVGGVATQPFLDDAVRREDHVLSGLEWSSFDASGSDGNGGLLLVARAEIRTAFRMGGPPWVPAPSRVVAARILVNGVVRDDFVPLGTRTFATDLFSLVRQNNPTATLAEPGPFLVSLESDAAGMTALRFQVPGLVSGDEVSLEVAAVVEASKDTALLTTFHQDCVATTACFLGLGSRDADCDGDGTPECCELEVPIPTGSLIPGTGQPFPPRRFAQWSFTRTSSEFRALTTTIP